MTEYDLEEFVNPCVVEKLATVYEKDGTYVKLLKEADLIYDKLSEELTSRTTRAVLRSHRCDNSPKRYIDVCSRNEAHV